MPFLIISVFEEHLILLIAFLMFAGNHLVIGNSEYKMYMYI